MTAVNNDARTRKSAPTRTRDGITILDIGNYTPFLLNAVSNAWQRKTSTIYRQTFSLGIVDWRVIAMLNIEPKITANRICEVVRLDKAATSRSLQLLHSEGHVHFEASPTDPRKRRWWLSDNGLEAHETILAIALSVAAEMLAGVAPEDLETFLQVMRRMLSNLES